jgi:hypothetical protein
VTGYPEGSFGGGRQATRAEAATMVVRLIDPVYRVSVDANSQAPVGSQIAFNPQTDVAADGRMKLGKAEEYMMKTLQSLRFFEEGGKFYFEGNVAEVPAGFENDLTIDIVFQQGKGISYGTYPLKTQTPLPSTGLFKVELLGINSRDQINSVMIILYIDAPNHTNPLFSYHGYQVIWTIKSSYDNRIEVNQYLTQENYFNETSKFYDLSTIFQW